MPLPEIIAFENRQKVVKIARELLGDRLGVIEAARQISGFRRDRMQLDESDPDFVTFVAIDSETDDLPLGESREYWAPAALAQKDLETARREELHRADAREAASRLVARFGDEKTPESEYI